ncbi:unnamed protein product, partial [Allacma fusca]
MCERFKMVGGRREEIEELRAEINN